MTFVFNCGYSQTDCSAFKKGRFSYTDSAGVQYNVIRKKNIQEEVNTTLDIKVRLKIEWLSDCQYRIKQVWSNSKAKRKFNGTTTTITITKTFADGYEYECLCTGTPNIPGKMIKLGNL